MNQGTKDVAKPRQQLRGSEPVDSWAIRSPLSVGVCQPLEQVREHLEFMNFLNLSPLSHFIN